jgi:outer membrane protein TolC
MCKRYTLFFLKSKYFVLLGLNGLFAIMGLQAQQQAEYVFSPQDFMAAVKKFHPVVSQAENTVKMARSGIMVARAGFDPVFSQESEEKKLAGDWYYQNRQLELVVPTWYGMEVTAGKESITGPRYNPERSVGDYSYLSLKVPLLKDLVMDKRRAALKQAKIFLQQSDEERKNRINDLLNEAFLAYWNWVRLYQQWQLTTTVLNNNKDRYQFIYQEYLQGFRAALDTVEAQVQWQQWQVQQAEAELQFNNAGIELSAFLWKENNQPYQLPESAMPKLEPESLSNRPFLPVPVLDEMLTLAAQSHPKLQYYKFKGNALEVDRLLKKQELLPKLNIKTQLLQKGNPALAPVFEWPAWQNNHKFGVELILPLRLSAARGAYRQSLVKISDNNLEIAQQQRAIENKVKSCFNEYVSYKSQLGIYEKSVIAYEQLYKGEWTRFQSGESSLFLLNSREMKWMESRQKLVDLQFKCNKSLVASWWASGGLLTF